MIEPNPYESPAHVVEKSIAVKEDSSHSALVIRGVRVGSIVGICAGLVAAPATVFVNGLANPRLVALAFLGPIVACVAVGILSAAISALESIVRQRRSDTWNS